MTFYNVVHRIHLVVSITQILKISRLSFVCQKVETVFVVLGNQERGKRGHQSIYIRRHFPLSMGIIISGIHAYFQCVCCMANEIRFKNL